MLDRKSTSFSEVFIPIKEEEIDILFDTQNNETSNLTSNLTQKSIQELSDSNQIDF